jgi:CHAT domain-containing protein
MIFPWELLIPNDNSDGKLTVLKPLGIAHILGRWKPGLTTKPRQQMLKVRRFRVLNPDYPPPDTLAWAAQEAVELQKSFPNLVSLVKPADLPNVEKLFNESDVQVLHFSGHGDVNLNNSDLNKILLENNTQFVALKLTATNLCSVAQPVVYMNACSVGNVGVTVGRAGGFASNFVTNGCSGVIAPLWPINDKTSMEFALALYAKLKLGRAVGEALQELRDQNAQDPTYCAYTFFGDPWVRLNLKL